MLYVSICHTYEIYIIFNYINISCSSLQSTSSKFSRQRRAKRVKFPEDCIMYTEKHVLSQNLSYGLNMGMTICADKNVHGNTLTINQRRK